MFKHITPYPWVAYNNTVWGYENSFGRPQVGSCVNKNLPLATQRANAKLMAIAPQMYELIRVMIGNEEATALVRYMENEHED
jgi:hypothetical protein